MLKFWSYRDDNNCWDYVRTALINYFNVPPEHVPKFGIKPEDKKGMHISHETIKNHFIPGPAKNGAIACRYSKNLLNHVGVVWQNKVFHVMSKNSGVRSEDLTQFSRPGKVIYYAHKSL